MGHYDDILEQQLDALRVLASQCHGQEHDEVGDSEDAPQDVAIANGERFQEIIEVLSALFFETPDQIAASYDESRSEYVDALKPQILTREGGGWTLRWAVAAPRFQHMDARLRAAEARQKQS